MIGLLVLAAAGIVPAANYENGNSLLTLCREDRPSCQRYVEGVSDVLNAMEAAPGTVLHGLCEPPHVTVDQETDVVVKYLEDNPASREQAAGGLVLWALHEAFPCRR